MAELIYTFGTATTELLRRLGGRTDTATKRRVEGWLNDAMLRLAKSWLELPNLEASFTLTTVDGQSEYPLASFDVDPNDVLGIRSIRNDTSEWLLQRFPWHEYRALGEQAEGAPVRWTRRGNLLAFDPEPDGAYELVIDYRRRPSSGTFDDFDSEWHEPIVAIANWVGWTALQQPQLANAAVAVINQSIVQAIQRPMSQDDFEAIWDQEFGLVPGDREL